MTISKLSDHPDAVRSRQRRAYQRYWRNMRNYRQAVDQMAELDAKADRSLHLALDALRADLSEWASKQEVEL